MLSKSVLSKEHALFQLSGEKNVSALAGSHAQVKNIKQCTNIDQNHVRNIAFI